MSVPTDRVISSTQTADVMIPEEKQIILVFDEHRCSYQLLAWDCCQKQSAGANRSLTVLVREHKTGHAWIGTLTTMMGAQGLLWINNLDHRRHQLRLSEQSDSIISHFVIQETVDSRVSTRIPYGPLPIVSIRLITSAYLSMYWRKYY